MRVRRRASSPPRRLASERAGQVEVKLRARSARLKPRTPLGLCHVCATIVYTGDSLAIAGGYLHHGECSPGGPDRHAHGSPPPAA